MIVSMKGLLEAYPGRRVVDAKKGLVVHVTAADIKHAKRKNPNQCAFACAIRREHQGAVEDVVIKKTIGFVVLTDKKIIGRYTLPPSMQTEVAVFDRGGQFAEGYYELASPPPSVRLGAKRPKATKPVQSRTRTTMIRGA